MIVRITAEKFCETDEQAAAFEAAVAAAAPGTDRRMVRTDDVLMGTAKIAQDNAMLASARITVRQEVIETVSKQAEDAAVAKIAAAVADDPALDQKAKDTVAAIISASTTKAEPKEG